MPKEFRDFRAAFSSDTFVSTALKPGTLKLRATDRNSGVAQIQGRRGTSGKLSTRSGSRRGRGEESRRSRSGSLFR